MHMVLILLALNMHFLITFPYLKPVKCTFVFLLSPMTSLTSYFLNFFPHMHSNIVNHLLLSQQIWDQYRIYLYCPGRHFHRSVLGILYTVRGPVYG